MGTLGGGNGERPHDGQSDGLPGLPPEWGVIVVPDDAAELAVEADEVRRELRDAARGRRWRRRLGLANSADSDEPSILLPLLIMGIAVVATLISLFAVAWPPQPRQATVATGNQTAVPVPDIALTDGAGDVVRLRSTVPAVVLLVDGCDCAQLVADVARATEPGIAVLPVDRTAPDPVATPPANGVRPLADPSGRLRRALQLAEPGGAASVALLSRSGDVIKVLPAARSVDEFRVELASLI